MKKLLLTFVMLPIMAMANLCDDVHALANRWEKLATAIHNRRSDNLSGADHKKVGQEDRRLIPPTRDVVVLCARERGKAKGLGNQLSGLLDEYAAIDDSESWDEDVRVIDKLVEVLDQLVKICDESR